jgi:hypothetical protein
LGHAQGCLESRHRLRSRGGATLAQVAVRLLARSNQRVGYMTCGPGPPYWMRRSRRGAPLRCGCTPPAWRSALSTAGFGEDGGVHVTAGRLHAPCAADWLLPFRVCLHDVWDPSPVRRIPLSKQSKSAEDVLAERLFPRKILTQRGFPPSSPRGRVGLHRGKADPSLTVRLYLCM